MVADRERASLEHLGVDLGVLDVGVGVGRPGAGRLAQRVQLAAQPVGQHLLQLGQRPGAGLLEAGHPRGGPQADGDGHGLLVVEQQRRQLRADAEAVAAAGAADGVDRVAELPQPGHVLADRAVGDVEPLARSAPDQSTRVWSRDSRAKVRVAVSAHNTGTVSSGTLPSVSDMTTTENNQTIRPFSVEIPQADLDDLRDRLDRTRFAPAAPGDSWDYGTPSSYLRDMVERWKSFDWREVEARINAHPNFLTEIDGQTVHFVHVRSAVPGARPLLLAHTYPGSVLEFLRSSAR